MVTINGGEAVTLARAIVSANNDLSHLSKRGHSGDTIGLPRSSTQVLTVINNMNCGPTGLSTIRSQIAIVANGSRIQRAKGASQFRVVSVAKTGRRGLE